MKKLLLVYSLCLGSLPLKAEIKKINLAGQKWFQAVQQSGIGAINICGNNQIQLTKSSIKKNFFVQAKGFFFSELISHDEYWKILKTMNKAEAEEALQKSFEKSQLWQAVETGQIKSLGAPKKIEILFKSTVKECVEGAQTTYRLHCSQLEPKYRENCCAEKFQGPVVTWVGDSKNIKLIYSPDPSVRLAVVGESKHRYCHVVDSVKGP